MAPRAVPERLYCSVPSYERDGTLIGTCGEFLPGKPADREQLAAAFGWQLHPEPLCPGHRAMAGKTRPVLDLEPPPCGPRWADDARRAKV